MDSTGIGPHFSPILNLSLCIGLFTGLKGANLMSRKKIKQVDAICQKTLETVIEA